MKKIGLQDLAEILKKDSALSEKVASCSPEDAPRVLKEIAAELGYELESSPKLAVSDEDLENVAGGRNPFLQDNGGELNPYSWFVSLVRLLLGREDDKGADPGTDGMSFNPMRHM